MVVALVRSFVLGPLRMWCVWKMEIKAMYDLSCKAFDTVTAQSMQFHSDRFSGSLVSQTNKFVGAYERLMDEFFWNIFPVALDILMIMIVMIPKAPLFVVGMVVFIIIYIVAAAIWFKKLAPIHEKEASTSNKCTGQLADSVSNVVSVKSYAREKYESARYAKYQGEWYKAVFDRYASKTPRGYRVL